MKTLNIFALDWNAPRCLPKRTWIFSDLRNSRYTWVEGMFHKNITDKINFDFKYNNLNNVKQIKELSKKNISYNYFVKFYQFRHLVGVSEDSSYQSEKLSFFYHYFKDEETKFIIDDIKSGKCRLILASLTELSNEDYQMYFDVFKKLLKKYDIPEEKVLIFDFINNIESMNKKYNTNIKFKYYNWLMVSWQHYVNLPDTFSNFNNKDYIRDKYYITLNKSVTKQHRIYLMHFLWKNNLIDKGNISFFHQKNDEQYKMHLLSSLSNITADTNLEEFYEWLNNNPLFVDVSSKDLETTLRKIDSNSSAPNEFFNNKTDNAYKNSYFNILTETSFIESELNLEFFLNERNVLPINAFQPFIVLNGNGHIKELKKLGFKTFSPYINEEYDNIKNPIKRFNMITNEISRLCNMSKQEIHDWYWSMEEIYKHNYNHLHNVFYPTQIKGFFDEFIYE